MLGEATTVLNEIHANCRRSLTKVGTIIFQSNYFIQYLLQEIAYIIWKECLYSSNLIAHIMYEYLLQNYFTLLIYNVILIRNFLQKKKQQNLIIIARYIYSCVLKERSQLERSFSAVAVLHINLLNNIKENTIFGALAEKLFSSQYTH